MIKVEYICGCGSSVDEHDLVCTECVENFYDSEEEFLMVRNALKNCFDMTPWIQPKDPECGGYVGFKNKDCEKSFLRGVKSGYYKALFWMADYFGEEMNSYYFELRGDE